MLLQKGKELERKVTDLRAGGIRWEPSPPHGVGLHFLCYSPAEATRAASRAQSGAAVFFKCPLTEELSEDLAQKKRVLHLKRGF